MKTSLYSIADISDPATRRALCKETALLSEPDLAAQSENPRAAGTDLALLVARDGETVVGVLGVVPDWILLDGERHRIGWMHNWNARAGGAGGLLLLSASRHYENGIGVSGCTPVAEQVYLGSRKLVELQRKTGASFFFHTDLARLVPARFPRFAAAAPVLRVVDRIVNAVLGLRVAAWLRRARAEHDLRIREVDSFGPQAREFMECLRWDELFRRGADDLEWMRRFSTGPTPREHTFLELRDGGEQLIGLAYMQLSRGTMTVPYFFASAEHVDAIAFAVLERAARSRARDVLVYSKPLADAIAASRPPAYATRPRSKLFLIGARLGGAIKQPFYIQDGDGDAFI